MTREPPRRSHKDIPQEPLFGLPPAHVNVGAPKAKPEREKTIRTAKCPECCGGVHSNKKVAVVRRDDVEVFGEHDKFTWGNRRIHCSGSGQEAPPGVRGG